MGEPILKKRVIFNRELPRFGSKQVDLGSEHSSDSEDRPEMLPPLPPEPSETFTHDEQVDLPRTPSLSLSEPDFFPPPPREPTPPPEPDPIRYVSLFDAQKVNKDLQPSSSVNKA